MAQTAPAAAVALRITTRRPRTSLIDAEWEWLAKRAESESANDYAFAERDTEPGLAKATPIVVVPEVHEPVPASTARFRPHLTLLFVATALISFALGMAALPVSASIAARLHRGSGPSMLAAQLHRAPAPTRLPEASPPEPVPERAATMPVEAPTPLAEPAAAKPLALLAAASKAPARRPSARRHWLPAPAPQRRAGSDNPY